LCRPCTCPFSRGAFQDPPRCAPKLIIWPQLELGPSRTFAGPAPKIGCIHFAPVSCTLRSCYVSLGIPYVCFIRRELSALLGKPTGLELRRAKTKGHRPGVPAGGPLAGGASRCRSKA